MALNGRRMDESHEIYQMKHAADKPAFEFCPKCGSSAFYTQDHGRSFRCEVCRFHFFINSSAAVACMIFNSSGELLLTRRAFEPNKGMLDLPGGFVDPMETAEAAVRREIMEELNLDVTQAKYLISFPNLYPYSDFIVPTVDLAYVCLVKDFSNMNPGDDVASVAFVHPEKIDFGALCAESMRQIIKYYLDNNSN